MEERDVEKVDEEKERGQLFKMNLSEGSIFVSQSEGEVISRFKIESVNEVTSYPSLEQRMNMSYIVENEDYFGSVRENSVMSVKENVIQFENLERHALPSKKEIGNKEDSISSSVNYVYPQNTFCETLDQKSLQLKITKFLSLNNDTQKSFPNFLVLEKCEVSDYIGFHKQYEIQYFEFEEEKKIKCYRRYDNFHKFHLKISRRYPFLLIPRLTPKNPLLKIINPDEYFYENRRKQLNFYLNFVQSHEYLKNSKEFYKFINDAEFDENYFTSRENEMNEFTFPHSFKISETFKNKIFNVFSGIFGIKEGRKLDSNEILLRRMETHYKGISEKYREIKLNMVSYLKSIKLDGITFNKLSDNLFYMKDTLINVQQSKETFKKFHDVCGEISSVNNKIHTDIAVCLENKFESFVSILLGLCDSFDRYNEYIKILQSVIKAHDHAKLNLSDNLDLYKEELSICNKFKNNFDTNLLNEVYKFVSTYDNTFSEILDQFKMLLRSINSRVKNT